MLCVRVCVCLVLVFVCVCRLPCRQRPQQIRRGVCSCCRAIAFFILVSMRNVWPIWPSRTSRAWCKWTWCRRVLVFSLSASGSSSPEAQIISGFMMMPKVLAWILWYGMHMFKNVFVWLQANGCGTMFLGPAGALTNLTHVFPLRLQNWWLVLNACSCLLYILRRWTYYEFNIYIYIHIHILFIKLLFTFCLLGIHYV